MDKSTPSISSVTRSVAKRTGLPEARVKAILSEYLGLTMRSVADDRRVVVRGFGTFCRKVRKSRRYRDIHTGELKESAPGVSPAFVPSRALLREMNPSAVPSVTAVAPEPPTERKEKAEPVRKAAVRTPRAEEPVPCQVIVSVPNPDQTDGLRIRYTPSKAFDSRDIYPVVHSPSPDALLKLPRKGRSDVRGYKEPEFLAAVRAAFTDISVSDDLHLKVPGRYSPYEPDIVLYDERLNLYIDVEIDEPYDGCSRLVTHITEGKDATRDLFFKESGWVVVRFSEKQVHLSQDQCIGFLRNVVAAMRGDKGGYPALVEKEGRWSRRQAVQWERDLYRERYLGIQSFPGQVRTRKVVCTDGPEGIDLMIRRSPAPMSEADTPQGRPAARQEAQAPAIPETALPPGSLAARKPSALRFNEASHTYASPGDLSGNSDRISVTPLIESFFPSFDEEAYIRKRIEETGMTEDEVKAELAEPSNRGTDMHKQIENYLKGLPYDGSSKEFQFFLRFHEEQIVRRSLVFDSAEFAIDLKGSDIAGTVDALFRKPDGDYVMVDWKRSKHLIIDGFPKKYGFGRGLSVISHLDNSSYYKYELQQSFYKYILEKDYGIRVSSMILAVLHPDYDRYYSIKLSQYREREVLDMIESYEKSL